MAADLQEPPSLILEFFKVLTSESVDVTIGLRRKRKDPFFSRLASRIFWGLYHTLVQKEMPLGGVDVFGCNIEFRDQLLKLGESNTSQTGLLLWLGFRKKLIPYNRLERRHGRSAWSLNRKFRYMMNSIFSFTDLPITLLVILGIIGLIFFVSLSIIVLIAKITGKMQIPGYTATVLTISFFAALNCLGLGVIGSYVWRTFENTKRRPQSIIMSKSCPERTV
jgi:polyisoprenyl-phosphate glycosyltransferase